MSSKSILDPVVPTSRRAMLGKAALVGAAAAAFASTGVRSQNSTTTPTIFNVRNYGALGDGSHDDTSAFQTAINAALNLSNGGAVYIPSGKYKLTSSLSVGSQKPIEIFGDGFSTALLWSFDGNLFSWPSSVQCHFCTIRDILIVPSTNLSPTSAAIICSGGCVSSNFLNICIQPPDLVHPYTGSGIRMLGLTDTVNIIGCFFFAVSGVGVEIGSGSEVRIAEGRIIGIRRFDSSSQCIGVHLTGNNGGVHLDSIDCINLFYGCLVENSSGAGSNRELFSTQTTYDGCFRGLSISDGCYVSIAGCWAASCDHENIYVDFGSPTVVIAGGRIYNAGAFGGDSQGQNGITVNSGTMILSGVEILNNRGRGIWVANGAVSNYLVEGCRIISNGRGADLIGNNYIVTGNIFASNGSSNSFGGSNSLVNNNIGQ